jgi:transcriptional regulator with XRE-family HTH domain
MTDLKRFLILSWYPQGKNDSDFAEALGVDQALVSKWATGAIAPPLERKIQISKVLGVDSRLIFSEENR